MNRIVKQIKSFSYAIKGIISVLITESHMRFHLVAAIYVLVFYNMFYKAHESSATTYALLLIIAMVLVCEIFNTAIERLCDTVTTEYSKNIKYIKDASAGAVLVCAIIAVVIACIVFIKPDIIVNQIIPYFMSNIVALVILIVSAVISILFIAIPPHKYLKIKSDKKKNLED